MLDVNGNLLFEEPYEVTEYNYDKSEIQLKDGKYNAVFDMNKKQIINQIEIFNTKKEEKYNIKTIRMDFVENKSDLIIALLEDHTYNIYNRDLKLLFENVGNIKYLELNNLKLSSNNKKTVVIDDNYNVIKTLDEDYKELKVYEYNKKILIEGKYSEKYYDNSYIEAGKYFDENLNLIDEHRVLVNPHYLYGFDDKYDLTNYGMIVVGDYYYNKWDYSCNDLVIYDFDYNIVKKFDEQYFAKDIVMLELKNEKYYLSIVDNEIYDLYDDKFNMLLRGMSYINADFLKDGILVCINGEVFKYSQNFESKELILKDVNNLKGVFDSINQNHSTILFIEQKDKKMAIDKNGKVVFGGYEVLYNKNAEVVYYESNDRKGYIRYDDKKEVSVEKSIIEKEIGPRLDLSIKYYNGDINYKKTK